MSRLSKHPFPHPASLFPSATASRGPPSWRIPRAPPARLAQIPAPGKKWRGCQCRTPLPPAAAILTAVPEPQPQLNHARTHHLVGERRRDAIIEGRSDEKWRSWEGRRQVMRKRKSRETLSQATTSREKNKPEENGASPCNGVHLRGAFFHRQNIGRAIVVTRRSSTLGMNNPASNSSS